MSLTKTLIKHVRKLPAGNVMIRVHIEHGDDDSTTANIYAEDKTLRIHIGADDNIRIQESKPMRVFPQSFAQAM